MRFYLNIAHFRRNNYILFYISVDVSVNRTDGGALVRARTDPI